MPRYLFTMVVDADDEDEAIRILEDDIHTIFENGESIADYGNLEIE